MMGFFSVRIKGRTEESFGDFHPWEISSKAALQWAQTLSEALQEPLLSNSSALELLSPQQECKSQSVGCHLPEDM